MKILSAEEWICQREQYQRRADRWIVPHLQRSSMGEKHPVLDFLFTYYSLRPSNLRRWHPGIGVALAGPEAEEYLEFPGYLRKDGVVSVSVRTLSQQRRESLRWVIRLLETTSSRVGFYGCHGLHEWAMVYREEDQRRHEWPLRVSPAVLRDVVETQAVCCSHYDAFRFFTLAAVPLNRLQPTADRRQELEQPACLHTNMDLYKWAFKFLPWISSEVVLDAFELAVQIREMDMRASPYDFASLNCSPITIETESGRLEYETLQREFAGKAALLRTRLIAALRAIEAETKKELGRVQVTKNEDKR